METVSYVERPEILPGERKCFHIRVPEGRHAYELRFTGRSGGGAVGKIYLPKADLDKGK